MRSTDDPTTETPPEGEIRPTGRVRSATPDPNPPAAETATVDAPHPAVENRARLAEAAQRESESRASDLGIGGAQTDHPAAGAPPRDVVFAEAPPIDRLVRERNVAAGETFDGGQGIVVLVTENPKAEFAAERDAFQRLLDAAPSGRTTVEAARAAGVTDAQLAWEHRRGFIRIDGYEPDGVPPADEARP